MARPTHSASTTVLADDALVGYAYAYPAAWRFS
jgi:hypothetical protein